MTSLQEITNGDPEQTVRDFLKLDQGGSPLTIDRFQYLRHLYRQMPLGIILNLFCAALVTWVFWSRIPHYLAAPWLIFIVLTSMLHLLLVKEFNRSRSHIGISSNWSVYNTTLTTVMALAWGSGTFIFFPLLETYDQFILLAITGFFVVAYLPILSSLFSCYLLFISIISASASLSILLQPIPNKTVLLVIVLCLYAALLILSAYLNRTLIDTFKTAIELKEYCYRLYEIVESAKSENIQLKTRINQDKIQT